MISLKRLFAERYWPTTFGVEIGQDLVLSGRENGRFAKNFYLVSGKDLRKGAFLKGAEFSSRLCRFVLNTEGVERTEDGRQRKDEGRWTRDDGRDG